MKNLAKSILITGILAIAANIPMVAQTSSSQFDQWYRAKYGRPAPNEQASLNTPKGNAVAPKAAPPAAAVSATAGFEQWYLAKYDRPSPTQEARLQAPQIYAVAPEAAQLKVTVSANDLTPRTPAEHEQIAQSYRDQAQSYLAQAQEHAAMVAMYKVNPNINAKNQAATIGHCEYYAAKLQKLAARSQELAQLHEQMAKEAGRN
jgi:hypothetical protein